MQVIPVIDIENMTLEIEFEIFKECSFFCVINLIKSYFLY